MPFKAVFFDLDDTLVVDEAVSKEALACGGSFAAAHHGAKADQFAADAARLARDLWKVGPAQAYCRRIGISAFECLWGRFEGESADLTQLREWALKYREQAFDAALREQLIEKRRERAGFGRGFRARAPPVAALDA